MMTRKFTKQLITAILFMHLTSCSSSGPHDKTTDILNSLTKEQKMTLLAMLENYEDNQTSINTWKSHQPNLLRLSEIEEDLKTLIAQLSVLSQTRAINNTNPLQSSATRMPAKQATKAPEPKIVSAKRAPSEVTNTQKERKGYAVQLTALESVEKLRAHWNKLISGYPSILKSRTPFFEKTVDSKGKTFLRLKFGEFESPQEADKVCEQLRSIGGICFISKNNEGIDLL